MLLSGQTTLSYDWAAQTWIPVPARFVAPDGARYAFTDSQSRINVFSFATGSANVISPVGAWALVGFTLNGVYAAKLDPGQPSPTGLYVLAPDGSSTVQLAPSGTWLLVGNDAAWSFASTEAAPGGTSVIGNVVGTKLVRLDLSTGAQDAWYVGPNGRIGMAALDRLGDPVLVGVDTGDVRVISAPNTDAEVFKSGLPLTVTADAHGIWIGHPFTLSIYLSTGGSPASRWGQFGGGGNVQFAGACG